MTFYFELPNGHVIAILAPCEDASVAWQLLNDWQRANAKMIGASLGSKMVWGRMV